MNNLRRFLYSLASLLGDINAIKKGKLPQRILRKTLYRSAGKTISKMIR